MKRLSWLPFASILLIQTTTTYAESSVTFGLARLKYSFEAGIGAANTGGPLLGGGAGGGFHLLAQDESMRNEMRLDLNLVSNGVANMRGAVNLNLYRNLDLELAPVFLTLSPSQIMRLAGPPAILSSGILATNGVRIREKDGSFYSVNLRPLSAFHDLKTEVSNLAGENSIILRGEKQLPLQITLNAELSAGFVSGLQNSQKLQEGLGRYLAATVGIKKTIGDIFYLRIEGTGDNVAYRLVERTSPGATEEINRFGISGMIYFGGTGNWLSAPLRWEEDLQKRKAEWKRLEAEQKEREAKEVQSLPQKPVPAPTVAIPVVIVSDKKTAPPVQPTVSEPSQQSEAADGGIAPASNLSADGGSEPLPNEGVSESAQ